MSSNTRPAAAAASLETKETDVRHDAAPDDNNSDNGSDMGGLFEDPPDYYPPSPPPTTEQHALGRSGVQLTLHLVGHSVLEAHRLWNGSRVMADYFEDEASQGRYLIRDKTVLELGAGAGLPGIVCGLVLGARKAVVTDYPDPDLVATIDKNIRECERAAQAAIDSNAKKGETTSPELLSYRPGTIVADGYIWGGAPEPMLAHLGPEAEGERYDVVLLADLLFRHAEHAKLAFSVRETLKREPASRAYVFFTSYRPWLRHKDLAFFGHACDAGLVVEHLHEKKLEKPPLFFEDDPGDVSVRSTVSGYSLRWPQPVSSEAGAEPKLEDPKDFWPPPGGIEGAVESDADAKWSKRAPPPSTQS
ncbi:nicotinamide n-methyltransferase [Ophiostoma piceae UAMH 11346]|uniref:Nicotinamide n-methyltransferase n=1 Tax=Ophiostoma piceae (strain UAMH 11346) TaxID=1262450 RepID=S3C9B9_OPHP1|nr:nicotinamide n-methyltransferase [Ophiostoma piceae UAMH 11346]